MKKVLAVLMVLTMTLSLFAAMPIAAAGDVVLTPSDVDIVSPQGVVVESSQIYKWNRGGYVGFNNIDMTGIKSISIDVNPQIVNWNNGEAFRLRLDDPYTGPMLGYLITEDSGRQTLTTNIDGSYSGKHTLYLVQNYHEAELVAVFSLTLSKEAYVDTKRVEPIPDSQIIDVYHDTWVLNDDLGRYAADYEEVGGVKAGRHEVGTFYFVNMQTNNKAIVALDAIAEFPEAQYDYHHAVWDTPNGSGIYWGEPIFGFYGCSEYWVYRKHAEMFANAGVDFVTFDCTNSERAYVEHGLTCIEAFHDARANGIKAPQFALYSPLTGASNESYRMMEAAYMAFYRSGEYADLWYKKEGKPVIIGNEMNDRWRYADTNDTEEVKIMNEMKDFFYFQLSQGDRNGPISDAGEPGMGWMWLENFPQWRRAISSESGRVDFMVVGASINHSYEYDYAADGTYSDPNAKGRAYTEAFGEDYREFATREGYFMKEQIAWAIENDPERILLGCWNEWHTARSADYQGMTNVFIDLYSPEDSRDMEPQKGVLKDNFYCLIIDMVRKYKGVRPAPTASGMKTIDVNGSAAQWDSVGPEFLNHLTDLERDVYVNKDRHTLEYHHYTTDITNSIIGSKATFDNNNIYFMAKTHKDIVEGPNFMYLFINTDRNKATGWEGFDYAINLDGKGVLSKFADGKYETTFVANVQMNVSGNVLQVAIPRNLIGETATVDLEMKWFDTIDLKGDIMNVYEYGNTAPSGRYNYLFTEIPQTTLTAQERKNVDDVAILVAGGNKMIVDGGKMVVYGADKRITPFEENGTLYIPERALEDIMGYGKTKSAYEVTTDGMYELRNFTMDGRKIVDNVWSWTMVGTLEARVDGRLTQISNPIKIVDGMVYVPASYIAECFDFNVVSLGNGAYAIARNSAVINTSAVNAVLSHLR